MDTCLLTGLMLLQICVLSTWGAGYTIEEFPICTMPSDQLYPKIDGHIVVWEDTRNGNHDIYAWDLSTKTEIAVCTHPAAQERPQIGGNIIAWEDSRNGNRDIYAYNLSTKQEFAVCTEAHNQMTIAVGSGRIAWIDNRSSYQESDLYVYDLSTQTEFCLFNGPFLTSNQSNPAISGDTILWTNHHGILGGEENMGGYNFVTQEYFTIEHSQSLRAWTLDFDGSIAVWQSLSPCSGSVMYNFVSKEETCIAGYFAYPRVSGNLLLIYDDGARSLYLYDISTKQQFPIAGGPHVNIGDIYDDVAVWMDSRNGSWDIFGAYFASDTAFTYQGWLDDNGLPAQNVYDFEFKLFDGMDPDTASQLGRVNNKEDVSVEKGHFAVSLDFGSSVFNGQPRWLQIGVRPGQSSDAFTRLVPLQPLPSNLYDPYPDVAPESIKEKHLAQGAVTASKLGIGSVSQEKIADNSVSFQKLAEAAVTESKIADGAIGPTKLSVGAVGGGAILPQAVTQDKIAPFAVVNETIAPQAVSQDKIADGAITPAKLSAGAVQGEAIAAQAVSADKIKDGAITASKLGAGAVASPGIAESAVTGPKIADGAITPAKLSAGAVEGAAIAAQAVSADKIKDAAVTASKLGAGAVASPAIAESAVTGPKIAAGAIGQDKIADQAVGTPKLSDAAVKTAKLDEKAVTESKLADAAVSGRVILDKAIQFRHLDQQSAATGQVIKWNGTQWQAAADQVGSGADSGWVHESGLVRLDQTSDQVAIGLSVPPSGKLHVSGTIKSGETETIAVDGENGRITSSTGTIDFGDDNITTTGKGSFGSGHSSQGLYTFVSGQENNIESDYSTIAGGQDNSAGSGLTGTHAFVGGGQHNVATGGFSAIPGGKDNIASGVYAFAAGCQAQAIHTGSVVIAANRNNNSPTNWVQSSQGGQMVLLAENGLYITNEFGQAESHPDWLINTSTGAHLSSGGSWVNASDRAGKENMTPADSQGFLEKLAAIPITVWNYKADTAKTKHIGPMAQDFYAAFQVGQDDTHISTIDADGIALTCIQGLYELLQAKDTQLKSLQQQNAQLLDRMEAVEKQIQLMKAQEVAHE